MFPEAFTGSQVMYRQPSATVGTASLQWQVEVRCSQLLQMTAEVTVHRLLQSDI